MDEARLKEKLAKVEALLAGATTAGEREAAKTARERLVERLQKQAGEEKPEEFRFSIEDPYARSLLIALARRYGLQPYRRRGQHRRSVMVKAPAKFVNEVLFPEYRELADVLHEQLAAVTQEIIAGAVHKDTTDAPETDEPRQLGG